MFQGPQACITPGWPRHQSGKARLLVVGSMQRSRTAPDVSTCHEGGVKDFVAAAIKLE